MIPRSANACALARSFSRTCARDTSFSRSRYAINLRTCLKLNLRSLAKSSSLVHVRLVSASTTTSTTLGSSNFVFLSTTGALTAVGVAPTTSIDVTVVATALALAGVPSFPRAGAAFNRSLAYDVA